MADRLTLLAALGDAHRLRIVDALALGDKAPSALSHELGVPSNLLAHHIGALTDAGAIRRRRSDGDGRRSYLSLNWDEPLVAAAVSGSPAMGACRVVFVCTANSARSQFAASLFARQSAVPVASAGTQPAAAINPHALAELERHGLAPLEALPRALTAREGDVIVAVCDNAYEDLDGGAQLHWSVPDPATAQDPGAFAASFCDIEPRVQRLAASLTNG
jgi:protein-tyrosine-phosphatase/DNA-binding transcriptional ArsR family regulator